MSAKGKQQIMKAAKERRQKQIVIAGAVLLAIIVAIQVPRLMKSGGSAPSTSATPTASTAAESATTPSAVPAASLAAPIAPAGHNKLPDSDVVPRRTTSQLVSFEMFGSKDPFVQQVSNEVSSATDAAASTATVPTIAVSQAPAAAPTAPSAAVAPAAPSSEVPASPPETAPTSSAPASSDGSSSSTSSATAGANQSSAAIEVNGARQSVGIGQTFPKANPTFKLVSLADGVAMIGIAGGSYASGAQTVSLQPGKALTLVNTADGVHYQLQLLSAS